MGKKDKRKSETTEQQPVESSTIKLFVSAEDEIEIQKSDLVISDRAAKSIQEGKRGRWCPWDRRGKCPYENKCSYAHVKDEKKEELLKGKDVKETELLCEYRIVLVDPQDSRNIGSVARLAANYGIDDIWIVSNKQLEWEDRRIKRCKRSQEEGNEKATTDDCPHRTLNTNFWRYSEMLATAEGIPLLKSFKVVSGLGEALEGVDRALAFTGKRGAAFRTSNVDVPQIPELTKSGRTALVFGNEAKGLSCNDTLMCSGICTLPTTSYCTSLNLSHSAIVVVSRLWELKHGTEAPDQGHDLTVVQPATDAEVSELHHIVPMYN